MDDRLALAKKFGVPPIDFRKGPSVDQIKTIIQSDTLLQESKVKGDEKITGILYGVDAVGYEAKGENAEGDNPSQVLDNLIKLVDPTGHIGIIGVFLPQDPQGIDELAKKGEFHIALGKAWNKGLTIETGQTPVKKYIRELRDLILAGKAKPSQIVSHHISIDEAPDAYEKFDTKVNGYTKVLIQFK